MASRSLFHLFLSIPALIGIGLLLFLFIRSGTSEITEEPTPQLALQAWSAILSEVPAEMPGTYPEVEEGEEVPGAVEDLSAEQKVAYPRTNAYIVSCSLLMILGVFGMNAMGISLSSQEPAWHGFLRTGALCAVTLGSMILFGFNMAFPGDQMGVIPLPTPYIPGDMSSVEYGLNGMTEWADLLFNGVYSLFLAALFLSLAHGRLRSTPLFLIAIPASTLIFPLVVSWKWGAGWIDQLMNNIDFAGAALLHWHAGIAILLVSLISSIAARTKNLSRSAAQNPQSPQGIAIYLVGAVAYLVALVAINAGSTLDASPSIAAPVLQATLITGGISGVLGLAWAAFSNKRPFLRYLIVGIAGGIVASSGSADYFGIREAIVFGVFAGVLIPGATFLLEHIGWIDPLSMGAIHGIGGLIAILGTAGTAGEDATIMGQITLLIAVPILTLAGALFVTLVAAGIGYLFLPSGTEKAPPPVPAR